MPSFKMAVLQLPFVITLQMRKFTMLNVATNTAQLPEFIRGHKLDEIQDVEQISHNLNPT